MNDRCIGPIRFCQADLARVLGVQITTGVDGLNRVPPTLVVHVHTYSRSPRATLQNRAAARHVQLTVNSRYTGDGCGHTSYRGSRSREDERSEPRLTCRSGPVRLTGAYMDVYVHVYHAVLTLPRTPHACSGRFPGSYWCPPLPTRQLPPGASARCWWPPQVPAELLSDLAGSHSRASSAPPAPLGLGNGSRLVPSSI